MQILSAEEFLNRLSERGSRAELCQLKEGHNSRPLHINFIANAFVVGSEGTIIDDETSTIFSNSFSSMKQSQVTASKISPRITASLDEALYIPGYVAHLCGRWSGNFFHWMSEILPRAFLLHNAGFGGLYMVPACQHPFIIDSLRMLGIPYERIISNDAEGPIQCEYLAAFDSFWFADHYENPWMMLNLRDFLLQKVDTTSPLPSTAQGLHIIMRNGSRSVPQ
jgi:hypothetical protein